MILASASQRKLVTIMNGITWKLHTLLKDKLLCGTQIGQERSLGEEQEFLVTN